MSITNLQQARQMYAMGQRVAKTLDGSRPGYRGPGGYQGGASSRGGPPGGGATAGGSGRDFSPGPSKSSTSKSTSSTSQHSPHTRSGYTGPTNYGPQQPPQQFIGGKSYDVTPTTRDERDRATLKQQILNQTVTGGNRIDKFGNTKKSPFKQGGGLGSLIMGALGMLMGIPGLGLLTGGIRSLGGGLKDLNRKFRGVNPDGTTRTQAQYEKARYDRQQQKRVAKLLEARDRGYNQIGFGDFTKKTVDFTPGQQATLDDLIAAGYGPTTLNAVNPTFQNDLGNPNMMNLNDVQSIVAASQMPQGIDFTNANAIRAMTQPTTYTNTPFEGARTVDTYRGVDPYKMNYLNRDLPTSYRSESLLDEQPQEEGIMGIDVGYPSNDLMAKVSNQDLARYSQQGDLTRATDYETAMDTIYQGSEMTPYEYNQLQQGNITQPGTYIG